MATILAAILDRVTALCSGTTRGVLSVFCEMHWVLVSGYGSEYYNWKLQYFAVCKQKQEFIATDL